MKTEFQRLCSFINENEEFTRYDLQHREMFYMETVDPYRRKLEVVGFIEKTGRGEYKRVKEIPSYYTLTILKEQYATQTAWNRMKEDKYPV